MANIGSKKHKFRVGQRVRPSRAGIENDIFTGSRQLQSGMVVKVDQFNCPTVLWDGRKTPRGYHPDFISIDGRRSSKEPANG